MVIRGCCPNCGKGLRVAVSTKKFSLDKTADSEKEKAGQLTMENIRENIHPEVADD